MSLSTDQVSPACCCPQQTPRGVGTAAGPLSRPGPVQEDRPRRRQWSWWLWSPPMPVTGQDRCRECPDVSRLRGRGPAAEGLALEAQRLRAEDPGTARRSVRVATCGREGGGRTEGGPGESSNGGPPFRAGLSRAYGRVPCPRLSEPVTARSEQPLLFPEGRPVLLPRPPAVSTVPRGAGATFPEGRRDQQPAAPSAVRVPRGLRVLVRLRWEP